MDGDGCGHGNGMMARMGWKMFWAMKPILTNQKVALRRRLKLFDSTVGSSIAAAGNGRIVRIPLTSQNLPGVAGSAWQDFTRPLGQRGLPVVGNSGWIWPEAAFDLHVGDEVVVFSGGDMLCAPQLQLTSSTLEAEGTPVVAPAANGALLAREVVRARLELLEAKRQLAANASAAASVPAVVMAG